MKILIHIICMSVFLSLIFSCASKELKQVRQMEISHVDLTTTKDGTFNGEYSYGSFTYEVSVIIINHVIADIEIVRNRDTKHAKKAEGVIERILDQQKNDVDAVSGATTTSKALLKAVENALNKAI